MIDTQQTRARCVEKDGRLGSGIYRIVNNVSGRTYIGSSINMSVRLKDHAQHLRSGIHKNPHLQRAWNKYGESSFTFEQLINCDRSSLMVREQQFIDAYHEHGLTLYNKRPCSHSRVGFEVSSDTRIKMSISNTGKVRSIEQRANISMALKGRKLSEEHRANVIAAKIGVPLSASHRESCRKAALGRIISTEQRAKISASLTGRKQPRELVEKRRISNIGKKLSDETRAKISASQIGKVISLESREKMRAAKLGTLLTSQHRARISESLRIAWQSGRRRRSAC